MKRSSRGQGSITHRNDHYHLDLKWNGKRRSMIITNDDGEPVLTKAEAEWFRADTIYRIKHGHAKGKSMALRDIFKRHKQSNPVIYESYGREGIINRFCEDFPCIDDLNHSSLGKWRSERLNEHRIHIVKDRKSGEMVRKQNGSKITSCTVNTEIQYLKSMLNWAANDERIIEYNPIAGFKRLKQVDSLKRRSLTEEEISRLLVALDELNRPNITAIVYMALYCGMRKQEILTMTWQRIIDNQWIYIPSKLSNEKSTKSRKDRTIPLPDIVRERLEVLDRRSKWVFPSYKLNWDSDHKPYIKFDFKNHLGDIGKTWRPLLQKAEIRDDNYKIDFHCLRHTFGTRKANEGMPAPLLMTAMGHSSITTTMIYYSKNHEELRKWM